MPPFRFATIRPGIGAPTLEACGTNVLRSQLQVAQSAHKPSATAGSKPERPCPDEKSMLLGPALRRPRSCFGALWARAGFAAASGSRDSSATPSVSQLARHPRYNWDTQQFQTRAEVLRSPVRRRHPERE